jgi:hypothetical protein|tara:strand:+ start:533 stop:775 length:243 start_codon:yes stop_codon:yes gene_type:complete
MAIKGGGTKKVCLPYAKYKSMSRAEKQKVISAKRRAGAAGKYKRAKSSFVKGARKKGATLRDWFKKERWVNIATGKPCGE